MEWVEITVEDVQAHMPTDVKVRYEAWLGTNPDRSGRLAEITANTLREFRDNLKSVQANIVDPRETWVPRSAVRHIETIIVFSLAMEMGLPVDSAGQGARYAADIFLRQILMGRYRTTTPEAGEPSPLFSIPDRSGISGRALPLVLALLLFAGRATAGWIRPDSAPPLDTQVVATFVPSAYSITASTLYGHLHGINNALLDLATSPESAVLMRSPYTVPGGAPAWLFDSNGVYRLSRNNDAVISFQSKTISGDWTMDGNWRWYYGRTLSFYDNSWTVTATYGWDGITVPSITLGTNAPITNWPTPSFIFPGGDFLYGDGTNLFYVTADQLTTNNLTGN